ncbi:MerR family transcriptional regulator [Umezawaea sp. Da 62-37]|uniref:MerR family transcriptional regulator n=1 Tax=Umezawaea sp. Da 62-37 TaxID=3075927 RepID=UPI0028F6C8E7|nr:MerR family transcriptional regulator [Umezawaea sp. Da 62-37]WNV84687.1 MerR family transcriptional regulator [Umezawaea sp. Da 62-37]
MWTIDELVERVAAALAAEYSGAPNGRVRDVPDRRAVRWYATTGLVDRPSAMRGRTALYDTRHLLQLVAVKRRQAAGSTLAEIQAELAGATDAALASIARVPEDLLGEPRPATAPVRPRFWAEAPAAPAPPPPEPPKAAPLSAIALTGGAVLLLPGAPTPADYQDIATAAQPLLDLLTARGLLTDERDSR